MDAFIFPYASFREAERVFRSFSSVSSLPSSFDRGFPRVGAPGGRRGLTTLKSDIISADKTKLSISKKISDFRCNAGTANTYDQRSRETLLKEEIPQMSTSLNTAPGQPFPLGASTVENGINFALFSQHAISVIFCLSIEQGRDLYEQDMRMIEIELDPCVNKTGDVWHICVKDLPRRGVLYGYRVDGPKGMQQGHRFDSSVVLIDPYAKLVDGRRFFGDASKKMSKFFGTFDFESLPFDWGEDYKLPNIPEKDLIIYEMNVRSFTADASSGLDPHIRGSYLGVIEKIPHLLELGVNAVELLPVFEFDEFEFQRHPNPRDHMINSWGYSTMNFFSPMSRYASGGGGPYAAALEFKKMVKALHDAEIEVILDVVYNHTNEAGDEFPYTTSFRGIDNKVYYMVDVNNGGQLLNISGCGNTLNCNHPVVMELILESLRHWVNEYHVDGFRFDLASILCRDTNSTPLNSPPIVKAIAKDSVLSRCKIIAEPWDCGGLYLVGRFPNWDRKINIMHHTKSSLNNMPMFPFSDAILWAEWNGKYRDDVRRFIKGDSGMKGKFATRLSGSSDMYQVNKRKPYHSINFVIAHDGFTLYDLVSYNLKHNEANGEGGRDGSNDNFSWNCGCEGETKDPSINSLRSRQMKNFHLALMVSQLEARKDSHFRFFSEVIKFRRDHHFMGCENFLTKNDVTWHEDDWDNHDSKFLAFTLHSSHTGGDIYVAFNAHHHFVTADIPSPPRKMKWFRVVDTNLPAPDDFVRNGVPGIKATYNVAPYSSILLIAKP
ncbi:unnamed protein product [Victoria cruziana]